MKGSSLRQGHLQRQCLHGSSIVDQGARGQGGLEVFGSPVRGGAVLLLACDAVELCPRVDGNWR